jgi:hypothetical protein
VKTVDAAYKQLPILLRFDDRAAGVLVRTSGRAGQPFRENEPGEVVARVGAVEPPPPPAPCRR